MDYKKIAIAAIALLVVFGAGVMFGRSGNNHDDDPRVQRIYDCVSRIESSFGSLDAGLKRIEQLLLQAKLELKRSLEESERLLALWKTVQSEKEIAQETVRQLRNELSSLKTTFTKYIKENRPKRNSIGVYGNTTSAGLFVIRDRLMVSAGQKWTGGLEVGAGVIIIAW